MPSMVTIYSIRNYEVIEKHELTLDIELREVSYQTIVSILKSTQQTSRLRGKAFLVVVDKEVYFASKIGKSYNVFHLIQ